MEYRRYENSNEMTEEEQQKDAELSAGMYRKYLDLSAMTIEGRQKYTELDDCELLEMYRDYNNFLTEVRKVRNLFIEKKKRLSYEMWVVRSDLYSQSLPILSRIYREYMHVLDEILIRQKEGRRILGTEED